MVISRLCIDTNVYSSLVRGDRDLLILLENATKIFVPVVVVGELLYGFKNGARIKANHDIFKQFISHANISIIHTNYNTAEIFADLKLSLKLKGRPVPTNDLWIAAQTIESGSTLVTKDGHFDNIDGLRVFKP